MLNLLRMDLYRMFRSKSFYICFGILMFTSLFAFGFLYVLSNPAAQEWLSRYGMTLADFEGETSLKVQALSILDTFHQSSISGGFFSVTIGILASLFIGIDFEGGFIKNIICVHENKWSYVLSKLCCLSIVNLIYVAATLVFTLLINVVSGGFFSYVSASSLLYYTVIVWVTACAYSALSLLIIVAARSKSAGIAAAIFINGGVVIQLLGLVLSLFNLKWLSQYTLYYNLSGLQIPPSASDMLKPVLIAVAYLVVCTAAGKIFLAKKDI